MSDLISREEALSHPFANGKYDKENANYDFILGFESYKEWLETLPIVEDRLKGEWIDTTPDYENTHYFECTSCGFTLSEWKRLILKYKFCPNCGADMRGK